MRSRMFALLIILGLTGGFLVACEAGEEEIELEEEGLGEEELEIEEEE